MTKDQQELYDVASRWDEAIVSNVVEKIAVFMSDDWVIIGSGGITTRDTFLQWIRSGDLKHSLMDSDEAEIKIYGDTGIVISKGTSAGEYAGNDFSLYEWSTSVFLKKQGTWQCVLTTLTEAKKA